MHTLSFSTAVLMGHRDGGQHDGAILLAGPDPNAVPREAWDSLFELKGESARSVRTVDVIAELDTLRRQALEPGPDEEFMVLRLPLQTESQDRYDAEVLAYFQGKPEGLAVACGHLLIRRKDLREVALDTGWARASEQLEAVENRSYQESPVDGLTRLRAQNQLIDSLEHAWAQFDRAIG